MSDTTRPVVNGPAAGAQSPPRTAATTDQPFVTIVVPALDEEGYIEACLLSLVGQWRADACEILVMDGGSRDATAAIVRAVAARHAAAGLAIRLLDNPGRIQSAAVNLAARLADPRCTVLLRADAHAAYPPGFVRCCVAELLRTGATSVVVPMRNVARADAPLQRAIAAAQSSRLGNGGSAHRIAATSRFVEHGHHAAFDRDFFLSLGGYDESFTHNEDAEFDHRQLMAGGRIWMCVDVPVTYFPRRALHSLARQYFQHGHGRARTLLKHRLPPRPRQMAPVVALGSVAGGLALAPVAPGVAVMALAYPALCLGWGAAQAVTRRDPWLLASGAALIAMHMGWANGFIRAVLRRRRPSAPRPRAASGSLPAGARAGDPPS